MWGCVLTLLLSCHNMSLQHKILFKRWAAILSDMLSATHLTSRTLGQTQNYASAMQPVSFDLEFLKLMLTIVVRVSRVNNCLQILQYSFGHLTSFWCAISLSNIICNTMKGGLKGIYICSSTLFIISSLWWIVGPYRLSKVTFHDFYACLWHCKEPPCLLFSHIIALKKVKPMAAFWTLVLNMRLERDYSILIRNFIRMRGKLKKGIEIYSSTHFILSSFMIYTLFAVAGNVGSFFSL